MRRFVVAVAAVFSTCALAWPAAGQAFDAGPHQEITNAAMGAEGFGSDANKLVQANNWFTDLYDSQQTSKSAYSGQGGFIKRAFSLAEVRPEKWPTKLINAATRMHFENNPKAPVEAQNPNLATTAGIAAEWNRLQRVVWTLAREARDENNLAKLLAVLGISLNEVQDFYAHTNWVEPDYLGPTGSDGPGWERHGYGSSPTWFDIPVELREGANVYAAGTPGHRPHGFWDSDLNANLKSAMAKDWEYRPLYLPAATSAYFATRQWIQAVRSWVEDDAFWARAQSFAGKRAELDRDVHGGFLIMKYAGHWHGGGEPKGFERPGEAGNKPELAHSMRAYFNASKTQYRVAFEKLIQRMAEPNPPGQLGPVPSSQELQRQMRIVVLKVISPHEGYAHHGEPPSPDGSDPYVTAEIDGQRFNSTTLFEDMHRRVPYDPSKQITFFKPVPATPDRAEPVTDVTIEVRTADVRWAGTDDKVELRLGKGEDMVFNLDKKLADEFERGDTDTFAVPIDDAIRNDITVGDINQVTLYKAPDKLAGGWKLGGVKLKVNGQVAYENKAINRWLEDDHRRYQAPGFVRRDPHGPEIPVWASLSDDDHYTGDDLRDVHPNVGRRIVAVPYKPGRPPMPYGPGDPPLQLSIEGGNRYGGSRDGDESTLNLILETITPQTFTLPGAVQTATAPVAPKAAPDLVVTEFFFDTVTIQNIGTAPSPPFRFAAKSQRRQSIVKFPGIPVGASATMPVGLPCGEASIGTADYLEEVPELDERNNQAPSGAVIC